MLAGLVRLFFTGFGLLTLSCVAAPPGPRGPLRGAGIEWAADAVFATSQGQATRQDGTTVTGTSDRVWNDFTVVPRRFELRLSPLDWMDLGMDLGWLDGGIDLRTGIPAVPSRIFAGNLAVGFRTGEVGPITTTKNTRSGWMRVEAYPLVSAPDKRLVLSLGLHSGSFYHELGTDGLMVDTTTNVMRHEVRLETALGLFSGADVFSTLVAIEPYWVVKSGAALASACDGCDTVRYNQGWGCIIVFRFALAWRAPWSKYKHRGPPSASAQEGAEPDDDDRGRGSE